MIPWRGIHSPVLACGRLRGISGPRCNDALPRRRLASEFPPGGSFPAARTSAGCGPQPSLSSWWRSRDGSGSEKGVQGSRTGLGRTGFGLPSGGVHDGRPPSAQLRPGESAAEEALTGELELRVGELLPSEQQLAVQNRFLRRLGRLLAKALNAEVAPFGSLVNGLWSPQSDVDICVRVPNASTRNAQINALRKIAQELARVESHHIEPRYGAQVPLLHWAPQRPGMIPCDISINNDLAVVNSRLLGAYVRLDKRLHTLGLSLKLWAQARGINDRSRGTLSSFALVLMLISFLQRRRPPVLPSLQDIAFSRSHPPTWVHGWDCRYCEDPAEIRAEMDFACRDAGGPNRESCGALLRDFFGYYACDYRHGVIRIRDTRSQLPPADESDCYLVVDNPFEVGKDVANVDRSQHELLRKELLRAWRLLSKGNQFRDLLQSST